MMRKRGQKNRAPNSNRMDQCALHQQHLQKFVLKWKYYLSWDFEPKPVLKLYIITFMKNFFCFKTLRCNINKNVMFTHCEWVNHTDVKNVCSLSMVILKLRKYFMNFIFIDWKEHSSFITFTQLQLNWSLSKKRSGNIVSHLK